jgi:hypothetical protein
LPITSGQSEIDGVSLSVFVAGAQDCATVARGLNQFVTQELRIGRR